jgi:hypothetical protein
MYSGRRRPPWHWGVARRWWNPSGAYLQLATITTKYWIKSWASAWSVPLFIALSTTLGEPSYKWLK